MHKVLIIDDEKKILTVAEKLLKREGYKILTSDDAEEALVILEEQDPVAIVLSDNRMPSMRGTEFFTKIKTLWPNTVRILMTAHYDNRLIEDVVNSGEVFRFLKKPLDFEIVKKTLEVGIEQFEMIQEARALEGKFRKLTEEKSLVESDSEKLGAKIDTLNKTRKMLMGLVVGLVLLVGIYPFYSDWSRKAKLDSSKQVVGSWIKYSNGTALDQETGKVWMSKDFRMIEGRQPGSWEEAMAWVEKMNSSRYGGFTNWRVPTVAEYKKTFSPEPTRIAFDKNKKFPVGYPEAFDNGGGYGYWSSEEVGLDSARYFFFLGGYKKTELKTYGNSSISVRLILN